MVARHPDAAAIKDLLRALIARQGTSAARAGADRMPPMETLQKILLVLLVVAAVVQVTVAILR